MVGEVNQGEAEMGKSSVLSVLPLCGTGPFVPGYVRARCFPYAALFSRKPSKSVGGEDSLDDLQELLHPIGLVHETFRMGSKPVAFPGFQGMAA